MDAQFSNREREQNRQDSSGDYRAPHVNTSTDNESVPMKSAVC